MEREYHSFLNVLKFAMHHRPEDIPEPMTLAQWQRIFALAQAHKLLPLFYEAACTHSDPALAPLLASVRRQSLMQVMEQTVKTEDFLQLYRRLSAAGYSPLVVKGISCRNLYPNPDLRPSSDEDLLVPPSQFQAVEALLQEFGLTSVSRQEDEVSFRKPDSPLHIELHRKLFPSEQQAYSHLNDLFEDIFSRSLRTGIQDVSIAVPDHTDHLLYLICHSLKHFLHSGFGIRQVCDLLLFTQTHAGELDWPRIIVACRDIRCVFFVSALFRIGTRHLGFDPNALGIPPFLRDMETDELPLLADILESGIYGSSTLERQRSSNITLNAMTENPRGGSLAASLFPGTRQLQGRYPYLKKHPWLLPVAWASRMVRYVKSPSHARETLAIGAKRLALLEQYDLIS